MARIDELFEYLSPTKGRTSIYPKASPESPVHGSVSPSRSNPSCRRGLQ